MTGTPSQRQQKILELLSERSAVHGGLYSIAMRELETCHPDAVESARVSVICHCVRELMLGAIDMLVEIPEPRQMPSSTGLTSQILKISAKQGGLDLRADQDLVPVPRELATALADLIETRTRENGRNQRNVAALVTGNADDSHVSTKDWSKSYDFFLKWTHADRHHANDLPDDSTIIRHLRVVEDVIEVRMNLFFENLAAVEDILALANGTNGMMR